MYIEHYGPMTVKRNERDEAKNGDDSYDFDDVKEIVLEFKPGGWY